MKQARLLSLFLSFTIVAACIFSGCHGTKKISVITVDNNTISDIKYSSETITFLLLSQINQSSPENMTIADTCLTDQTASFLWEKDNSPYLTKLRLSDGSADTIKIDYGASPILLATSPEDRYFIVFLNQTTPNETNYSIGLLNNDGSFAIAPQEISNLSNTVLFQADVDTEGNVAIATGDSVLLLNQDLQIRGIVSLSKQTIIDVTYASDGKLYALSYSENINDNTSPSSTVLLISVLNENPLELEKKMELPDTMFFEAARIFATSSGITDGLELVSDTGVFSYSFQQDQWITKSLRSGGEIGMESAQDYYRLPDGSCLSYGISTMASGQSEEGLFKLYFSEALEKETLTLGVTLQAYTANDLQALIDTINSYSTQYTIEIVIYGDSSDTTVDVNSFYASNASAQELLLSLNSDSSPDLLCLSASDYKVFLEGDVLLPLNDSLLSDAGLSEDDVMDIAWNAYCVDESRYAIAPFYRIDGIAGEIKTISNLEDYTYSDIKELADQTGRSVAGKLDQVFDLFFPALQLNYVDYLNCSTWLASGDGYALLDDMISYQNDYDMRKGDYTQPLLCHASIGSYSDFLMYSSYFTSPISVCGYPGLFEKGVFITYPFLFAIPTTSKNPENAHAILKDFLSYSVQREAALGSNIGIPILKEAFEEEIRVTQIRSFTQTNIDSYVYKNNDTEDLSYTVYEIKPNEDTIETYIKTVSSANNSFFLDYTIKAISEEESSPKSWCKFTFGICKIHVTRRS